MKAIHDIITELDCWRNHYIKWSIRGSKEVQADLLRKLNCLDRCSKDMQANFHLRVLDTDRILALESEIRVLKHKSQTLERLLTHALQERNE